MRPKYKSWSLHRQRPCVFHKDRYTTLCCCALQKCQHIQQSYQSQGSSNEWASKLQPIAETIVVVCVFLLLGVSILLLTLWSVYILLRRTFARHKILTLQILGVSVLICQSFRRPSTLLVINCMPLGRKATRRTALLWPWKERIALARACLQSAITLQTIYIYIHTHILQVSIYIMYIYI